MRNVARWMLAGGMVFAGVSHLFWARKEFRAQVPPWTKDVTGLDPDAIVVGSGIAEIGFGAALIALPKERRRIGVLLALFFAAVFPGNVSQFANHRDGFGLDTDMKRFVRLFFQPALIVWTLWSTRTR